MDLHFVKILVKRYNLEGAEIAGQKPALIREFR